MAISNPEDLRKPGLRLIALDVSDSTIGVAIADPDQRVASPLATIARKKFRDDAARLASLIGERKIGGLIIGLPVNMDGSEGPRCQSVRAFAANLVKLIDLPISFWDERMSTQAIERAMIAADVTRARRARAIDQAAAAYILQGFLDRGRVPSPRRS